MKQNSLLTNVFGLVNPLPRLTEALSNDDFREIMNHAFVCKEFIYASDAHLLVRLKTAEHFNKEFIEQIPEIGFFFDRYLCYALNQKNIESCFLTKTEDDLLMNVTYGFGKSIYFPVKTIDKMKNIPGFITQKGVRQYFDQVIPKNEEKKRIAINELGLKGTLAARIQKALGDEYGLHLYFFGKDKAIFVEPASFELREQGRIGILMPLLITQS